jgi:2-polyprenyl-6-methoxyphenol hydroxylase-like FAD-dependent oxidoreductase
MSEDFDVVVVGGRCAGAPLGTHLARAGLSVAVLDKDEFPSDTPSTHFFQVEGVNALQRLGVLDRVRATGAPVLNHVHSRITDMVVEMPWPLRPSDTGGAMCVRRPVLDTILLDAAAEASAKVSTGTRVTTLVHDEGRVLGVRAIGPDGDERDLRARLVVGADGRGSIVARQVKARKYHITRSERFACWGYYEAAAIPKPEAAYLHRFDDEFFIAGAADDGLFMVVQIPTAERLGEYRKDPDEAFEAHLANDDVLAGIAAPGRRVGPLQFMFRYDGYLRDAAGPGWVLVGDSGHFKDPSPGQGISDAFRQVEVVAPRIVEGLGSNGATLDAAMRDWWRWRDADAFEKHWFAQDLGAGGTVPEVLSELLRRLHAQGRFGEFVDVFNHRVRPSKVLTPPRLFGAALSLLRRGGADRRQVVRDVRTAVATDVRRRRLNRRPHYVEAPGTASDAETEATTA